ncbi:MAG: HpaII family restriction endonuclease, partial [Chitinophagales bacterium]
FAGIGGFHIAMHNLGGKCVFASEMDVYARKTYQHHFKKTAPELFQNGLFNDDIRNVNPADIPDFDVLCAGFPCQPFSQAGYKRGFEDNHNSERGNLFFNIAEIIEAKKPKAFFLENVRGLVSHDKGKTFQIIRDILENELGYSFYYKVVKASDYGLPQLRPRVFIIGFRDEGFMQGFSFPSPKPLKLTMSDVWEGNCSREIGFTIRVGGRGSKIHDRRNWDAYLVDGEVKQLGVKQGKKMQGFPDDFEFPVSNTQAIKQLGNSVAIDAVQAVGEQMLDYLNGLQQKENEGFGIKSYLGSKPTLLNASGNTNFIFEVKSIDASEMDTINQINTRTKLKDRIQYIEKLGGSLVYVGAEREVMEHNLKISDSLMPHIVGHLLLSFYKKRISKLTKIVEDIHKVGLLNKEIHYGEKEVLEIKIKRLLIDILLGFFAGKKWDGEYLANGTIVMKKTGDCVGFHIVDSKSLKDYLFENVKLDTPSTTRHRFGKVYKEKGGKLYFKLNLQLRF